jgi:hypothetical protein
MSPKAVKPEMFRPGTAKGVYLLIELWDHLITYSPEHLLGELPHVQKWQNRTPTAAYGRLP